MRLRVIMGLATLVGRWLTLPAGYAIGAPVRADLAGPAGAKPILFVSGFGNEDWKVVYDIFVINPDGTARANLTKSAVFEYDPVWSPDGKQIAFAALAHPKERRTDVWVMNADGSRRRQLTHHDVDTISGAPAWSPDGRRIAFHTVQLDASGGRLLSPRIWVMGADGKDLQRRHEGMAPKWSPDGGRILYTRMGQDGRPTTVDLWVTDADGSHARLWMRQALEGAWSPDGRRIAYVGMVSEPDARAPHVLALYTMNADGSKPSLVTRIEGSEFMPQTQDSVFGLQWIGGGDWILFSRVNVGPFLVPYKSAIYVMEADGKSKRRVTEDGLTSGSFYGTTSIQAIIALYQHAPADVQQQFPGGR